MDEPPVTILSIVADPPAVEAMGLLLQQGCTLTVTVGCSVRSLLCDQLGIESRYVDERIGTIFINGKPADDIDRALVTDGMRLALSAAMPGLVGAMLRRKGFYAAMRSSITYRTLEDGVSPHRGRVILKLFNLLVRDLGPGILKRGVLVGAGDLRDFLIRQPESFCGACSRWMADGNAMPRDEVMDLLEEKAEGLVALTVSEGCGGGEQGNATGE